ncbi:MAG: HPr family phosphocarrier protein [Lachnospiraceae bacterium]|nr:HPr family phosphocarrier protein [Lachnospiraceae bacterium]
MVSRDVVVNVANDAGRKLAMLVSVAGEYSSRIYISYNEKKVNAKSIMGVMNLVPYNGDTITVTAEGTDEDNAAEAIAEFFSK